MMCSVVCVLHSNTPVNVDSLSGAIFVLHTCVHTSGTIKPTKLDNASPHVAH